MTLIQALDIGAYLAELAWAMLIADRILRAHGLPRDVGLFWCFTISPIYYVFVLIHPWGLIVLLCGWPFYWLLGPRSAA